MNIGLTIYSEAIQLRYQAENFYRSLMGRLPIGPFGPIIASLPTYLRLAGRQMEIARDFQEKSAALLGLRL